MAKRLLEFPHLAADGMDRHVQPLGRAGAAAFLGDASEGMRAAVVEHADPTSEKQKFISALHWFIRIPKC